jgi:hypothetical protein
MMAMHRLEFMRPAGEPGGGRRWGLCIFCVLRKALISASEFGARAIASACRSQTNRSKHRRLQVRPARTRPLSADQAASNL